MWDLLKKTDIDRAKQDLKLRRSEILRRQAEEKQILDGDQVQLETLNRLIDAFAQKFMKSQRSSPVPIVAPVANNDIGHATAPAVRHRHHLDQPRTNFDTFARAVARG